MVDALLGIAVIFLGMSSIIQGLRLSSLTKRVNEQGRTK